MKVLKGVLSESHGYYRDLKSRIDNRLKVLPKGSVKKRILSGKAYYYLQYRKGAKVIQEYMGKEKPLKLEKMIQERRALKRQLKEINQSLKLLSKIKSNA